jgi:hypothetical protein
MALVARAQEAGLDPEQELRGAARRFADQVRDQEQASLSARALVGVTSKPRLLMRSSVITETHDLVTLRIVRFARVYPGGNSPACPRSYSGLH